MAGGQPRMPGGLMSPSVTYLIARSGDLVRSFRSLVRFACPFEDGGWWMIDAVVVCIGSTAAAAGSSWQADVRTGSG
jgi:hypothetical protein